MLSVHRGLTLPAMLRANAPAPPAMKSSSRGMQSHESRPAQGPASLGCGGALAWKATPCHLWGGWLQIFRCETCCAHLNRSGPRKPKPRPVFGATLRPFCHGQPWRGIGRATFPRWVGKPKELLPRPRWQRQKITPHLPWTTLPAGFRPCATAKAWTHRR